MTPIEQFQEKVLKLQTALLENHPTMPVLLREIHEKLRADPEVVTLMSEDEIAIIVSGLERQTQTKILETLSSKPGGKSLKKVTVADL